MSTEVEPVHHCESGCCPTFECAGCHRLVGWCRGCFDDMPDHCDDCWVLAHAGFLEEIVPLAPPLEATP